MELPKFDFSEYQYPLKTLFLGNEDVWNAMGTVVSDLALEQLLYKHPNIAQRNIAEIVNHALEAQYGFYTRHLVVGEPMPADIYTTLPKTTEEAQKRIIEIYEKNIKLWQTLTKKEFNKEIHTEWGQVLTGELALFQSIAHTYYHVSEICFLRGLGGFPTSALG